MEAIPCLFERLFLISWENNGDCHITMPLSLKTIEVQIKGTTEIREVYNNYVANFYLYDLHDLYDLLLLLVTCYGPWNKFYFIFLVTSISSHLSLRYVHVILVSGYPVVTAVS